MLIDRLTRLYPRNTSLALHTGVVLSQLYTPFEPLIINNPGNLYSAEEMCCGSFRWMVDWIPAQAGTVLWKVVLFPLYVIGTGSC